MFEKNLAWETKRVDLFNNEQYDAEYLKYNPKGLSRRWSTMVR